MGLLSTFRSRATPINLGHDFAVVDVETTGLSSQSDRIVQIAITQLDRRGGVQQSWDSLIDPGRDPGPVHIHGITAERLRGAPTFNRVALQVTELLNDRVVVAHNAGFDWGFLHAESTRAALPVTARQRMCTLTLARRLDLELPDFKLETLASRLHHRCHGAGSRRRELRVLQQSAVLSWRSSSSCGDGRREQT